MKCNFCNKDFQIENKHNPYQIYCSKQCNRKSYSLRNKERLNKKANKYYHDLRAKLIFPTFSCCHCGVSFSDNTFRNRRFCSKKCLKNNWIKTHREYMNKVVTKWAKQNPDKTRSIGRKSAARRYKRCRDSILHNAHIQQSRRRGASGSHILKEWNEVKKKFDFACVCCGKKETEIKLTRDHIIPIKHGGSNSISNIQPLCFSCNASKKTRLNCQRTH